MRTLISQISEPQFLLKFPSITSSKGKPVFVLHYKCIFNPKNTISTSFRASCTANSATSYNGWDDLRIRVDSGELGESNLLKKFLISLGINDKKYVVTCVLGFVCALAISRVKVPRIIVFPSFAIVFAIGFWFGFANGGSQKGLNVNMNKRRIKDETFRLYVEKLKSLVEIFDRFDAKIGDLKRDVETAIEYESVDLGELESYVNAIETISGLIFNARYVVKNCISGTLSEVQEFGKNSNHKNSKKKKKSGNNGFALFEFGGGFGRNNAADSSDLSRNNVLRKDDIAKDVVVGSQEDSRGTEGASSNAPNVDASVSNRETLSDGSRGINSDGINQETNRVSSRGERNIMEQHINSKSYLKADEYNYQNIGSTSTRRFNANMSTKKEIQDRVYDDEMTSQLEFDIYGENLGNEASLWNQENFLNSDGAYNSFEGRENMDFGRVKASVREEWLNVEDELLSKKYRSQLKNDISSISSTFSDGMLFDKYLSKANDLLEEAKECLKLRTDDTLADERLCKSSELLHQAISLKPMSLLAIGQLGNTYLLHGELKLKMSREMRSLLSRSDDFGMERRNLLYLEDSIQSKDEMENLLVSTCEECEALLVKAGRTYRMALSIDGTDVRALYNWGLALSFRAQLISDVGPDAAVDADKLFMAAIDKFNAMMSKSNDYAPEALFRWGMVLHQRSRLRPSNSRDKMKLLQQAKRLYEDAVNMGSNSLQVRKALSSCISELNFTDI